MNFVDNTRACCDQIEIKLSLEPFLHNFKMQQA